LYLRVNYALPENSRSALALIILGG
jgi:hypothetical protein